MQAGAQPDWYIGPFEGVLRLMPGFIGDFSLEWVIPTPWGGNSLALPVLIPMIPVGIMFLGVFIWPWIEAWITGDRKEHHLLDRPRNAPTRTAVGAATMTFYMILWGMGSNDIIATHFSLSLNDITYWSRVLVFVGPVIAYLLTKRICLALQRKDRETALHGHEAGVIEVSPDGGFHERHTRPQRPRAVDPDLLRRSAAQRPTAQRQGSGHRRGEGPGPAQPHVVRRPGGPGVPRGVPGGPGARPP